MAEEIKTGPAVSTGAVFDEKHHIINDNNLVIADGDMGAVERELQVTEDDLLEAKEIAASFTLEDARRLMTKVHQLHARDPNFPEAVIEKIEMFLNNEEIYESPEKHELLIQEIKIEAALITYNSPYAVVRSVVDNHDDPTTPVSTIRAWFIGIIFAGAVSFINAFFDPRQPAIYVSSNVAQLLAFPAGKFLEKVLPDVGITLFGTRHSLNPGPFNKKEHMLITIMASIAPSTPYTNYVVWIQYLPEFFNQSWAKNFGYQITIALSTNFIGYGLAGLVRRWLVYPSYCVWPASLVTIALNQAFHTEGNIPVEGPLKKMLTWSRLKFFCIAFAGMFVYFWFPNYIFEALSIFNWMAWIAPNNIHLTNITGSWSGLGLNPIPTFDWNFFSTTIDPLMIPFFTTANYFVGSMISFFVLVAIYYSNTYNTAYLPINSNHVFDNTGARYNVTSILNEKGIFDAEKYEAYSPPFLAAGNIVVYLFFFAVYSATVTYGALYHWREISMGFKSFFNSFRKNKNEIADDQLDVHNRLMKAYKEVPEWWYMIVLLGSIAVGVAGIAHWPTNTTPAVVIYGVVMCLLFIIPIGIINAITGVQVTLNVLAEFIGGSWVEGNAIAMCFFKSYGYVTCAQALQFSNDLKLAHYVKIPPRMTFWAQMVPTVVSTFICVGVMTYQINLDGICTEDAPFRFTCPGNNTFFTAAVLWGTVGPKKMWGVNAYYSATLLGFPLGVAVVLGFWYLQRLYPKNSYLRSTHPVVMFNGMLNWAPYNLAYIWPAVPIGALSWVYAKRRYLGAWSKYNYVLSASFSCAIAICAIIQFFALSFNNINIDWWGNDVSFEGCEGVGGCILKTLAPGETFGPGGFGA